MAKRIDRKTWFLGLNQEEFKNLCQEWMAQNYNVPKDIDGYDGWLNYFKTLSPTQIRSLMLDGEELFNAEAYSALRRWADIIENPGRIDKIYQAGLAKPKTEEKSITDLARSGDVLGVLYAIQDGIAEKLDKGTGARDTANLAREMRDIMSQIEEEKRKQGPAKGTLLADLVKDTTVKPKGARKGSYKAKTIKEMEADDE